MTGRMLQIEVSCGSLGGIGPTVVAAVLLSSYLLFVAIYRLTLHPLARYPGPWLAKVTELYPLYRSIVGDRHLTFWRLHEHHGDFVRYGPNQLSINTNTGLKTIYGHKANVQKSSWYSVFPPVKGAWSVWTCIDKVIHSRKRWAWVCTT